MNGGRWQVAGGLLLVGFVFLLDAFVDFPKWTYLDEAGIWFCPGESNSFQFCTPNELDDAYWSDEQRSAFLNSCEDVGGRREDCSCLMEGFVDHGYDYQDALRIPDIAADSSAVRKDMEAVSDQCGFRGPIENV